MKKIKCLEVLVLNSASLILVTQISDVNLRWRATISFYAFTSLSSLSLFLSLPPVEKHQTFCHPFPQTSRSVVPFGPHYQHDYSLLHRKMLVSTMISFFWIASMPAVRSVSLLSIRLTINTAKVSKTTCGLRTTKFCRILVPTRGWIKV